MPDTPAPIQRVFDAAGGPVALSRSWGMTPTAVFTFRRQGYLPLARALDAVQRFGSEANVTLRDLVRPDIAAAMERNAVDALLG